MAPADIVAKLLEADDFDPREYMLAGDWLRVLRDRGGSKAPADLPSVRKDYHSPLGYSIHIWVEQEGQLHEDFNVVIEAQEDFDPRAYLLGTHLIQHLEQQGFKLSYGRTYRQDISTPKVDVRFSVGGTEDSPDTRPGGWIHVEARPADWASSGRWSERGDYQTLFYHGWQGDPPTDAVDALLAKVREPGATFKDLFYALWRMKVDYSESVAQMVVDKLLEADEFDPKEYILGGPPGAGVLQQALIDNGWRYSRRTGWGYEFRQDYQIGDVDCDLKLVVQPEFPFECYVVVYAHYQDKYGNDYTKEIEQDDAQWEMNEGENVDAYVDRIGDGLSGLRVPDYDMPEPPDEDWERDR